MVLYGFITVISICLKKKPWDSSQPWGPRVRGQHPGTVGDHGGPLAGADGNDFGESNHQNQN